MKSMMQRIIYKHWIVFLVTVFYYGLYLVGFFEGISDQKIFGWFMMITSLIVIMSEVFYNSSFKTNDIDDKNLGLFERNEPIDSPPTERTKYELESLRNIRIVNGISIESDMYQFLYLYTERFGIECVIKESLNLFEIRFVPGRPVNEKIVGDSWCYTSVFFDGKGKFLKKEISEEQFYIE